MSRKSLSKNSPLNKSYTILSYFTPQAKKVLDNSAGSTKTTPLSPNNSINNNSLKHFSEAHHHSSKHDDKKNDKNDDSDEDISVQPNKKRRRIIQPSSSDSESDSDNANAVKKKSKKINRDSRSATPEPLNKKPKFNGTTKSCSFEEKLQAICKQEAIDKDMIDNDENDLNNQTLFDEPTLWTHNKVEFLKPGNIRDKLKRKANHPEYDSGTLHVPDSYLNTLTPAMRQWWELKSDNFDCVLFFKVGKFYELYHMDADVGVNELGFTYMKGEFAHSGFPEQSFDRMATSLVAKGYKVARVEQTETPEMMQDRCKNTSGTKTKYDKVVKREICQVVNRGTQVFGQQVEVTSNHQPNYLLAVVEKNQNQRSRYGICFIDTSIGQFHIGEFEDDIHCSRLLTLLSHYPPVLVLHEKPIGSLHTTQVFKMLLSKSLKESLANDTQFWNSEKTLKILTEKYFANLAKNEWPETIKAMQDPDDHLGLTALNDCKLALKALGGCLWYLTKCFVDDQIVAIGQFIQYEPTDRKIDINNEVLKNEREYRNPHMVLDSITLNNLRIVDEEYSLLSTIDHCCTKFGKRLLHNWLCAPSCDKDVIKNRQEAVTELLNENESLQQTRLLLSDLPDLERQLAQIHAFGNSNRNKNHPDSRAILYEQKTYNKKKIQDFIATINGFDALTKIPTYFSNFNADLIKTLTQLKSDGGTFPDMKEAIDYFKNAFNHEEALKTGVIAPERGLDKDFDDTEDEIALINNELKSYLKAQEKYFGCRVTYFGNDKKRFQLEVPESNTRKASRDYLLEGQKKGYKRYYTAETKELLRRMIDAENERNCVLNDLSRRIFERFSNNYKIWKHCIDVMAILDILTSFTIFAQNLNDYCFANFVEPVNNKPILEIRTGYHPCMTNHDFIPNDFEFSNDEARLALLTGPNMGGKSTLMRQIGLLVILSHIGCPVPAESIQLTIIDRIFTRLGAQDDIMAGHSTFLVELSETSAILKHATVNSLVLLDELGRGTATYDGTAIAASVVNFLADLKCLTLFSTHYHSLVDNFQYDKRISLGHMACMVECEDTDDPTKETVTFLYKYSEGVCPKSYGFNAAKLAGMKKIIIQRAYELSKKVEAEALKRRLITKVIQKSNQHEILDLLRKLDKCIIKQK